MKGFPIFAVMESTRQKKVSRLIQKELANIFQKQELELLPNVMISVTIVRVSQDFSYANIFISIFPSERPDDILQMINNSQKVIRKELAKKVRYQLRIVPELKFYLDDSAAYFEEIDRLLKK